MATGSFKLPISSGSGVTPWVRPADWLPMPTVTAANDTFVALTAVFPEGQNWVAFNFTTSAGQYQVDWGDGTVTLHNSGTDAQYQYNYATVSNATLTTRGYKQVIIKVTAVSGLLRNINIQRRFVTSPAQNNSTTTPYLDIILSMPNATSMNFGNSSFPNRLVERVQVLAIGTVNTLSSFFNTFSRLQSVSLPNTSGVTNINSMFAGCTFLQEVPLFDTTNVNNSPAIFTGCSSLKIVPLLNTVNFQTMDTMFFQCSSLETVPLFNTQNVTNMSSMFAGCGVLRSVPLFNTANVTGMNNMFNGCAKLQTLPLFNTIKVTTMASMFENSGIRELPVFNTIAVVNMSNMFKSSSIVFAPFFNTQNVTNMAEMFASASFLQSVPLYNTIKVTNMIIMFSGCGFLQNIPALNTSAITPSAGSDFAGFSQNAINVDRIQTAFARTVSVTNNQLSRTALVEIFTNLANRSATTSATITISGNWGASALTAADRLIATSKNWVIVG